MSTLMEAVGVREESAFGIAGLELQTGQQCLGRNRIEVVDQFWRFGELSHHLHDRRTLDDANFVGRDCAGDEVCREIPAPPGREPYKQCMPR